MEEQESRVKIRDPHDPKFRIKTVDELNQNWSKYDGIITYFRPDGVIPERMKSREELTRPREYAPIYYGRNGEKYGADVTLTDKADVEHIALDNNGIFTEPIEEIYETETAILEEDFQVQHHDSQEQIEQQSASSDYDDGESIDGMSEAQRRIQSAIIGEFDMEKPVETTDTPKKISRAALIQQQLQEQTANSTMNSPTTSVDSELTASNATSNSAALDSNLGENRRKTAFDFINETGTNKTASTVQTGSSSELKHMNTNYIPSKFAGSKVNQSVPDSTNNSVILKEKETVSANSIMNGLIAYLIAICVAVVLSFVIVTFVGQKTTVRGDSMNATLKNNDQLIVDKLTYRFKNPERYDIVVFPESHNSNYVKRIIGLPGETISVEEGYIYINGEMLTDDVYGNTAIAPDHYYRLQTPITLGSDEYFVMGDNRNNSTDSRDSSIGNISKSKLTGRVIFRMWPFNSLGKVE